MFLVLNLGPLSIPLPEFILLIGFWAGSALSERRAKLYYLDPNVLEPLLWTSLGLGLIGARLSFIARYPYAFKGQLRSIISLNPGLLDPVGGFLIAAFAGYIIITRRNLLLWTVLDSLTPFFGIMAAAVHLSRFASGNGYGSLSTLPWAVNLWGSNRHPVQLYLCGAAILTLIGVMQISYLKQPFPGNIFLSFTMATVGYFLFLSRYQAPGKILFEGLRVNQIVSWVILCFTLLLSTLFSVSKRRIVIDDA